MKTMQVKEYNENIARTKELEVAQFYNKEKNKEIARLKAYIKDLELGIYKNIKD